ncbi:fimbrial protein [Klebsiella sp. BIGb0407]|uniref:fimbrial protein n=1 Tax=Klebsiella sp. BIGb0407 TaxID=2940603 RepID=UPI00216A5046|nr:fimbrial protein [Klebsiella sp. BIGb0407]MCS3430277.1 type 1 fimbria pilin [Klebsiella sp. BIGb0407]
MRQIIASIIFVYSISMATPVQAIGDLIGGDLKFKGVVVAQSCSIVPSSKSITVDFNQISTRTLYTYEKSAPEEFVIELEGCSKAVFNSVTVTFSGMENGSMANRLAITPVSPNSASGIGIGFEENDGTAILLNTPTTALAISDGHMQLNFKAFVEGEPDALSNKTLQTGAFRATANYTLNYQ